MKHQKDKKQSNGFFTGDYNFLRFNSIFVSSCLSSAGVVSLFGHMACSPNLAQDWQQNLLLGLFFATLIAVFTVSTVLGWLFSPPVGAFVESKVKAWVENHNSWSKRRKIRVNRWLQSAVALVFMVAFLPTSMFTLGCSVNSISQKQQAKLLQFVTH